MKYRQADLLFGALLTAYAAFILFMASGIVAAVVLLWRWVLA